jgi:hypothetical protein
MNGTTRIKILSVIFVLLTIAAWFSLQEKLTTDTINKNEEGISIQDTSSIEKINIQKDGLIQELTRKGNSWLINNHYEVRVNVMNLLLMGLNQLEIKRPVADELKNKVADLLLKQGTKVSVVEGDKTTVMLFARNENDINTTYFLSENSKTPYVAYVPGVPGDINNIFKLKENEWRNRDLFRCTPGEIQELKVNYPEPQNSFEIFFKEGNLNLKGVSNLDSTNFDHYLDLYGFVPVAGYIVGKEDSIATLFKNSKQLATIDMINLSAAKSNSVVIYLDPSNKKEYLGKLGKSGEPVILNKEIFDRLLVKKDFFIKK